MYGARQSGTTRPTRIVLWSLAGFFLALSAWLIPGSIWGTSENSPLGGGLVFAVSIPVLLIALSLLWLAVRAHRRRGDRVDPGR